MRILITGGSGLIGRALTASLASDGHEVVILSRTPERVTGLPESARAERWDARTAEGWEHLADGAHAIVNLAGASLAGEGFFPARWTEDNKRRIWDSRMQAGAAVVAAVEAAGQKPHIVVQASAVGFYGPRGDEVMAETDAAGDDFLARVCVDWEQSTASVEALDVRRVVIRTGVVLTPAGGALWRLLLPFKMFAGGPFGNGRQWWSWIHLADEVAAIRFLIENELASGVYNLSAPNPLTNRDFSKMLGRVMHRPAFMPAPGIVLRLMFGEVATVVLDGQRVIPRRLQEAGFIFQFPEAEAALGDLLAVGRQEDR